MRRLVWSWRLEDDWGRTDLVLGSGVILVTGSGDWSGARETDNILVE